MSQHTPVVVIVGGGFGGLAAARALKKAPVKVVLIDRANHHLFQPLLYQVATSVLAPGQIARRCHGDRKNSGRTSMQSFTGKARATFSLGSRTG
jgi:NADH dehydrogenase FAD-containing subunit